MAYAISTTPPLSTIPSPRWATRKEAMAYGRIGGTKLNELMRSGSIKAKKLGVKVLIDLNSIDDFFESLPQLHERSFDITPARIIEKDRP